MNQAEKIPFKDLPFERQLELTGLSGFIPAEKCEAYGLMEDQEGKVWFFFDGEAGGGMGIFYLVPRAVILQTADKTITVTVCGGWAGADIGVRNDGEKALIDVRNDPDMKKRIEQAVRIESPKPDKLVYLDAVELPFWPEKIEFQDKQEFIRKP